LAPAKREKDCDRYELGAALRLIYKGGAGDDLSSERAKLAKEQALAQSLRNKVAKRELLPFRVVAESMEDLFLRVRSGLAGMPRKIVTAAVTRGVIEPSAAGKLEALVVHYRDEAVEALAAGNARRRLSQAQPRRQGDGVAELDAPAD
jgi:hypothetical protein